MDKVSIFGGTGFIGKRYSDAYPIESEVVAREELYAPTGNILYFLSTNHNYNAKEGKPLLDIETNLVHFMKVLDANASSEMVFNYVSTWFVYGNTEQPAKENSPCNPTGFYSITKRCAEQLLISYCETFHFKYRILRLGNVIGIGDKKISRKKNALQHMVRELAQGRDVDYLYKGGAIRDFIDIRDCVEAIHLVLEKGETNQIYNIANGRGLNINDLVYLAWAESGYKSKIKEIDVPEFHKVSQTRNMYLDNKKIKSLGYSQKYDIAQSIKELIHYYETNENLGTDTEVYRKEGVAK